MRAVSRTLFHKLGSAAGVSGFVFARQSRRRGAPRRKTHAGIGDRHCGPAPAAGPNFVIRFASKYQNDQIYFGTSGMSKCTPFGSNYCAFLAPEQRNDRGEARTIEVGNVCATRWPGSGGVGDGGSTNAGIPIAAGVVIRFSACCYRRSSPRLRWRPAPISVVLTALRLTIFRLPASQQAASPCQGGPIVDGTPLLGELQTQARETREMPTRSADGARAAPP